MPQTSSKQQTSESHRDELFGSNAVSTRCKKEKIGFEGYNADDMPRTYGTLIGGDVFLSLG